MSHIVSGTKIPLSLVTLEKHLKMRNETFHELFLVEIHIYDMLSTFWNSSCARNFSPPYQLNFTLLYQKKECSFRSQYTSFEIFVSSNQHFSPENQWPLATPFVPRRMTYID